MVGKSHPTAHTVWVAGLGVAVGGMGVAVGGTGVGVGGGEVAVAVGACVGVSDGGTLVSVGVGAVAGVFVGGAAVGDTGDGDDDAHPTRPTNAQAASALATFPVTPSSWQSLSLCRLHLKRPDVARRIRRRLDHRTDPAPLVDGQRTAHGRDRVNRRATGKERLSQRLATVVVQMA